MLEPVVTTARLKLNKQRQMTYDTWPLNALDLVLPASVNK
jgi:hypothetical protein